MCLKNKIYEIHGIRSEMSPYGSVRAHIKTGRSPMGQDRFKAPPDPNGAIKNPKIKKKKLKVRATPAKSH